MSWNVKGLNNAVKKRNILAFIKAKKIDIIFIQETHLKAYLRWSYNSVCLVHKERVGFYTKLS